MTKRTDPLNRVDAISVVQVRRAQKSDRSDGRTTTWHHDIQARVTSKEHADGSKVFYLYENTTDRIRQRIDEKSQVTQYTYEP